PSFIKSPVADRSCIDMEKTGMRIPTNPAALHRPGSLHCPLSASVKPNIECAPVDVLAIFGNTEVGSHQHRVGLTRAVRRKYCRLCCPDRVHDAEEEIEYRDVDRRLLARIVVAQEIREFCEGYCNRAHIVAKRPIKGFAGMCVEEPEPSKRRHGRRG